MRVIFARPGGLVLRFSGHGLCAFLPWDRASKPVVHNVTTALVPAQIWICMASSWQAECAFASEHTFPVGSILAASRGNSQAWLDPGNPGRTPTTRPGCGLPAWSSGCACLAVARWYGRAARASHSSGSRGVLPAPLALQRRCRAVRHRDLPGAWVQPRSHTTRTGRAPVASVCSWAPRFRRLLTRSSPENVASGRVSRWVGGDCRGPARATGSHFPSLWWVLPQEPVVRTTTASGDGDVGRIRSGSPGVADQTSSRDSPDRPAISGQTEADSGHIQRRVNTGNEHGTSSAIPTEDAHRW
jgi:hypothetical protein